jgi:hypothetical protein
MKKLFFTLIALIALTVTAQAQTDSTKVKTTNYVSASLSLANSVEGKSFNETTYASVEYGIVRNGVAYGLAVGRGQLQSNRVFNGSTTNLQNYFWEVRVQPTFPLGSVTGSVILGAGSYFGSSDAGFIEYGVGVSKSYGDLSYGLSYSNWDGINYVTPSVSYSF